MTAPAWEIVLTSTRADGSYKNLSINALCSILNHPNPYKLIDEIEASKRVWPFYCENVNHTVLRFDPDTASKENLSERFDRVRNKLVDFPYPEIKGFRRENCSYFPTPLKSSPFQEGDGTSLFWIREVISRLKAAGYTPNIEIDENNTVVLVEELEIE